MEPSFVSCLSNFLPPTLVFLFFFEFLQILRDVELRAIRVFFPLARIMSGLLFPIFCGWLMWCSTFTTSVLDGFFPRSIFPEMTLTCLTSFSVSGFA